MGFIGNLLLLIKKLTFHSFLFLNFYSFMAVLTLHCCAQTFASWEEQRLLSRCDMQASHSGKFSCCGAQALGHMGFNSCGLQVSEDGLSGYGSLDLEHKLSSCGTGA